MATIITNIDLWKSIAPAFQIRSIDGHWDVMATPPDG